MGEIAVIRASHAMQRPKGAVPAASSDPIRAWRSGNRWFLAQCGLGTGKLGNDCAGQCAGIESGGSIGWRRGQRDRMAGLADTAGIAVRVICMIRSSRGMTCAVGGRLRCVSRHDFGILMSLHPRFMGVSSYYFCSSLLLHLSRDHCRRHGITDPAAQRQQGDHDDEEQVAHGVLRGEGFLKVQFVTRISLPLKTA